MLWVCLSLIAGMTTAFKFTPDYKLDYRDPDPTADDDLLPLYDEHDFDRWNNYMSNFLNKAASNENNTEQIEDYDLLMTAGVEQEEGWRMAGHGEYPYSVILWSKKNKLRCGGAVLTSTHLITSCSCLIDLCKAIAKKKGETHFPKKDPEVPEDDAEDYSIGDKVYFSPQLTSFFVPNEEYHVRYVANYKNCIRVSTGNIEDFRGDVHGTSAVGVFSPPYSHTSYGLIAPWPPQPYHYSYEGKSRDGPWEWYYNKTMPPQLLTGAIVGYGFRMKSPQRVNYYVTKIDPADTMIYMSLTVHDQSDCASLLTSGRPRYSKNLICMCLSKPGKKFVLLYGNIGTPVVRQGKLMGFSASPIKLIGNFYCLIVTSYDAEEVETITWFVKELDIEQTKFYKHRTSYQEYDVFVPSYMWSRQVTALSRAAVKYTVHLSLLPMIFLTFSLTAYRG